MGTLNSSIIRPNIAVPVASDVPDPKYTTTSNKFVDLSPKIYFYVESETGRKTLQIRYSGKTSNVTWFAQIAIDEATFTDGVSGTDTAFEEKTEEHDADSLTVGWHYLTLQGKNNGVETTTIENWHIALTVDKVIGPEI